MNNNGVSRTPALFSPLQIRALSLRNRIGVSPMCMYSCVDGMPTDFHLVHLGSRAVGGAGIVIAEATGVEPVGRITEACAGIYSEAHVPAWERITRFVREQGAVAAIQLAHAGRKAGWSRPWPEYRLLRADEGGWTPIGPSPVGFDDRHPVPREMQEADIARVRRAFVDAARRAVRAGFQVIELHAAHGYLLHSFLSPLSNRRTDGYGGSFEGRTRLLREVAREVRSAIPDEMPLWVRLSCTDWIEGGWTIEESVELARELRHVGVDLIDCSSGGAAPGAKIPVEEGYQADFARRIRAETGILTAAVGMITRARHAQELVAKGFADVVLLARELLRDPYWPTRAAKELGADLPAPVQYRRAW
jgi:2,4-dienoyl-CoA reductase-like NADH-dependent reductase (Old Yellow Enzyme family)